MDGMHDVAERRLTAAEWEKHFEEQPASGKRVNAYCREQGLTTHKFYYWRARLRGRGPEPGRRGFVECRMPEASLSSTVVLECRGGYRLHIGAGFDEGTLKRVLGVLAGC